MRLLQILHRNRDCLVLVDVQHKARQKVIIPDPHRIQNRNRDQRRLHDRNDHAEEGLRRRAAVDHGRLLNLQRDTLDKAGEHEDRKAGSKAQIYDADSEGCCQMQDVRELRQREHNHLERHDHGEHAQKVDQLRAGGMHAGNIPCAHGAAHNDQQHGHHRDECGVAEAAEKVRFLQRVAVVQSADEGLGQSLLPLGKAFRQRHIADAERIFENIGLSLERVQEYHEDRADPEEGQDREQHCQKPAVPGLPDRRDLFRSGGSFSFSSCCRVLIVSHHCSTSLLRLILFWISAMAATRMKKITALA